MDEEAQGQAPNEVAEEVSLGDRMPESEPMIEQEEEDDAQNQIRRLAQKTESLHADEQFLKQELKVRERQTLVTYNQLAQRKKRLLQLVKQSFNRKTVQMDISLSEELQELRSIVKGQQDKIQHLKEEISKQGLAGVANDESYVKIKNKTEEVEKEIKVGRKFSSTQYVRDYLERPQAYKVSYEESKYEYEMRLRLKESLQYQKLLYEKKKEEISQAKKRERELEQQLHKQRDSLSR